MRFEDEPFVKVYQRDTVTWKLLPWQARAVFLFLIRKVDRAGILDFGDDGLDGICAALELPHDFVNAGLPALLERGTVVQSGTCLVIPRYIEGQTAKQSDKIRQRESRERARTQAVTPCDKSSRRVTPRHALIQNVTLRSDQIRSDQTRSEDPPKPPVAEPEQPKPSVETKPSPVDLEPEEPIAIEPVQEPEPMTKADRLKASEKKYRDAYVKGIIAGKGKNSTFSFEENQQGTLNTLIKDHAKKDGKSLRGQELLDWITAVCTLFVEDVPDDEVRFYSAYQPRGLSKRLNEGLLVPHGGYPRRYMPKRDSKAGSVPAIGIQEHTSPPQSQVVTKCSSETVESTLPIVTPDGEDQWPPLQLPYSHEVEVESPEWRANCRAILAHLEANSWSLRRDYELSKEYFLDKWRGKPRDLSKDAGWDN